jgi:hypothetical protein
VVLASGDVIRAGRFDLVGKVAEGASPTINPNPYLPPPLLHIPMNAKKP